MAQHLKRRQCCLRGWKRERLHCPRASHQPLLRVSSNKARKSTHSPLKVWLEAAVEHSACGSIVYNGHIEQIQYYQSITNSSLLFFKHLVTHLGHHSPQLGVAQTRIVSVRSGTTSFSAATYSYRSCSMARTFSGTINRDG